MSDYQKTPSFYNSDEVFKKYLGQTSYYSALQNAVCKVVKMSSPKEISELGSGTGSTAIRLAKENPNVKVFAVDMREDMVNLGKVSVTQRSMQNVEFIKADMVDYVENLEKISDMIVMLYAFHHILDPLDKKIKFLELCKDKLPQNGLICIGETFLPEAHGLYKEQSLTRELWAKRSMEGYASTFWASLENLSRDSINKSKEIGSFSFENEWKAGEWVAKRDNEYLISVTWLENIAKEIGFEVVLAEPVNSIGESVVLLRK